MNRRTLLYHAGGFGSVAGLAGCLGSGSDESSLDDATDRDDTAEDDTTEDGDDTTEDGDDTAEDGDDTAEDGDDTAENDTTEDGDFSGIESADEEPFQTFSVGSRTGVAFPDNNRPHKLRVWNAADSKREISVQVSRQDEILLDRTLEFAGDAYLEVTLNEPADYIVAVGPADGRSDSTTVEVERDFFDCNSSATNVGVMPDWRVESAMISTLLGCYGPQVAETDISVRDSQCGSEHSATIAYDGERVRVDGAVRTSTPHSDLELAGATYDQEATLLTVRVREIESEDSGPGTECVGEVSYEATVGFEYALPEEVLVVHESMDETVDVATKKRA